VGELRSERLREECRLRKEIGLESRMEHAIDRFTAGSGLEPEDREKLRDEPD